MAIDRIVTAESVTPELGQAHAQGRRYPDFLCIGAQKAGTTWLDSNLRRHPQVWLPPIKELHYFSAAHIADNLSWASSNRRKWGIKVLRDYLKRVAESDWDYRFIAGVADIISGDPSDEWYGNIFSHAGPNQVCGEITPAYSLLPRAGMEHVKRLMPDLKLLIMLRDPIERSWSHLRMLAGPSGTRENKALIRSATSPAVAERSNYPKILNQWAEYFSEDRFLIVFMDDIVSFPDRVLRNICEFLGVEYQKEWYPRLNAAVHVGREISIPSEVYEFLKEQLHPVYTALKIKYPGSVGGWLLRHYGTEVDRRDHRPTPILSVVVCTRDRRSKLKFCVDALLAVTTARNWELIIVDNASADETSEYLASIDQKQFNSVKVTTTFEPKRGLAAARNKGWRTASGGIIAFTDDDCYVSTDYVDSVIQVFDEDQNIGFLGGRILLFDALDYRITIQESQQRCDFQPWTFIAAGKVQGANMAFRRTTLERIGGFDVRLGAGTPFPCEDIDAAAEALWAGIRGVYDPRPVVYHHHGRRTEREAQKLMRSYDAGRGAYYAKYILRRDSRSEYIRYWIRSIRDDWDRAVRIYSAALRRGRLPHRGVYHWKSLRELYNGLRFALQQWLKKKPAA
jgi:GT2 family glycosyltransferase